MRYLRRVARCVLNFISILNHKELAQAVSGQLGSETIKLRYIRDGREIEVEVSDDTELNAALKELGLSDEAFVDERVGTGWDKL